MADLVRRVDTMRHDQAKQHQEELRYAIVRQYAYDPATIARAEQALAAAQALHAAQPGYAGGLVIDDRQHFIAVNLWQTQHHAAAGRGATGTQVQRLLEPPMATPSQLLGAGEVVVTDLADHQRPSHHTSGETRGHDLYAAYRACQAERFGPLAPSTGRQLGGGDQAQSCGDQPTLGIGLSRRTVLPSVMVRLGRTRAEPPFGVLLGQVLPATVATHNRLF